MGLFDFLFSKKKPSPTTTAAIPAMDEETALSLEKIEIKPGLQIPRALIDFWPEIEKTRFTYNSINAVEQNDLALEQSKLAHYPCMPIGFDYPIDADGEYMFPLAQINFKEMPPLEGYPKSGYLQLYISAFDDVYGMDFNDAQSQKNFRVLFFEEHDVEKYIADFSFLDEIMASQVTPVPKPHALTFTQKDEYFGFGDVRYEDNQTKVRSFLKEYDAIESELMEKSPDVFDCKGHKIGGYAFFIQTDPRMYGSKFKDYILLFQLDSKGDICWGDVGVGHLLIHPDDLAKKDFSKVIYHWDCY